MRDAIILIFANKQDLPEAMRPHEIQEKLGLTRIRDRNWYVQPACATTGDGLYEGLTWLTSNHKSWTGSYWWRTSFFPFYLEKNLASFVIIIFFFWKKEKKLLHEIFVTLQNTKLKPPTNSPFHSARVRKKTEHSFFKNWKVLKEKKPRMNTISAMQ